MFHVKYFGDFEIWIITVRRRWSQEKYEGHKRVLPMSEDIKKKINDDDDDKGKVNWGNSRTTQQNRPYQRNKKEEEEMGLWGILLFGLVGATATTLAITRSQSWKGATGRSFRSGFQEEAWKRYNRRMQEEYEEELERVVSFSS
uniref:Transmembrane protein n=1 Tax=Lactuca sativa TaxID=4236 RepID=A0A9R1UH77_LACSA|nr:hypothetical protein LSAT_V11C900487730 [Lactuca sativa]